MAFWNVKDFTTGLAVKIKSFVVNTDENVPAHVILDSAGNEVIGAKNDAAWDGAAASTTLVAIWKFIAGKLTLDYGVGTGGSKTLRVAFDTAQFGTPGPQTSANSTSVTPASTSDSVRARINSAATTNAANLKASAGLLRGIELFNTAAYSIFLKFYDKASAPTVGTDTPVWTIPIPAGGGYSKTFPYGVPFATGISYAITKLQADSDTTAIAVGDATGIALTV
jgi:hypothetical protein